MKHNRRVSLALIVPAALLFLLLVSIYLYMNDSHKKDEVVKISAIVYGTDTERWATLKQGMDQGALDFNAEVNLVTVNGEKNAEDQEMLIKREIENGADGIILAAADSHKLSRTVLEYAALLPVVLVESGVRDAEGLTYISADNYSMGLNIGRSVHLGNDGDKAVAVFADNLGRNSVAERYKGFMDSLRYADCTVWTWQMPEGDSDPSLFLQARLKEDMPDVVVALEDKSLEALIDAVQAVKSRADIYGIGSTNKIVHYLDYGTIDSVVFANEFNMGYLSVQELIRHINGEKNKPDIEIEFRTINRETMYLPKNQRLVFPIVQ